MPNSKTQKYSMVNLIFYESVDNVIPKIKGQWREKNGKVETWMTESQYAELSPLLDALSEELDKIDFELEMESTMQ